MGKQTDRPEPLGVACDIEVDLVVEPQNDVMIGQTSLNFGNKLVEVLYGPTFAFFAKFLRKSGMSEGELEYFKPLVFCELARMNYLEDPSSLVRSIVMVLSSFYYEEADTQRLILRLKETYESQTKAKIEVTDEGAATDLTQLIEKILDLKKV